MMQQFQFRYICTVVLRLLIVVDSLLMASSSAITTSSSEDINTNDRSALVAFKSHLLSYDSQSNRVLNTNWSESVHVCDWIGVTCGKRHRRVTALNLHNMHLVGTIPPQVGNLSFLAKIDVSGNSFQDPLPRELALLPRLEQLIFGYNNFGGEIPSWLGLAPKLQEMDLSNNHFIGSIPPEVFNISSVNSLNLSSNNLFGSLPESSMLCDNTSNSMVQMKYLDLSQNQLHGKLPSALFKCKQLQELYLHYNNFTGNIPAEIANLRMLAGLRMGYNDFEGKIPNEVGYLQRLETLTLSYNEFVGTIPPAIFNLSSLRLISIGGNQLTGFLPVDMCDRRRFPELEELYAAGNNLAGSIPKGIRNCTRLRILSLPSNKMTGAIPNGIGYLQRLEKLTLPDNEFFGTIPPAIFNLSSLRLLNVDWNQLTGVLPVDMCDRRRFPKLEVLHANSNNLAGSIPRGIHNCTSLRSISLRSNILTGAIPYEIPYLPNIEEIDLYHNRLSGTIPRNMFNISTLTSFNAVDNGLWGQLPPDDVGFDLPNLQYLYLGMNNLSGPIPNWICNSSELALLDFASNSFNGFVPRDLGNNLRHLRWLNLEQNLLIGESSTLGPTFLTSLSNCKELKMLGVSLNSFNSIIPKSVGNLSALEQLWFEGCNFQGTIPTEIGNLRNLITLRLGWNSLRGQIPATIGQLKQLQLINLEINSLQGSIPTDLCQLHTLGTLDLGANEISGSIPACLGNITSLRHLSLGSNRLISEIPSSLWTLVDLLFFNLSANYLEGKLSSAIGNLRAVLDIDLSDNLLQGILPQSIGSLLNLQTLYLQGNKFQGQIPDQFASLFSLQSLDLSRNDFSGRIPVSLVKLLQLRYLNLSFNHLEGEIPSGGPFSNLSADSFFMNKKFCGDARFHVPPCSSTRKHNKKKTLMTWIKLGLPVFLGVLLILAVVLFGYMRRRRQGLKARTDEEFTAPSFRRISQEEIFRATEGFNGSNLLGQGSFGSVYKGTLFDGILVAIKVFNLQVEGAFKSFNAECDVLRSVRHRNLVKVISSCSNEHLDFKALVLEYMPSGSLEKWLYAHNNCLTIIQRLDIAIDVATGLEYLHHGQPTPVLHCDLKPSNVLLDAEMVAHVSDFGIAKLLGDDEFERQTMTLATIGYMAPEYGSEGMVSPKTDVYSFGILVMEIFTRKRPSDDFLEEGEMNLRRWVEETLMHAGIKEVVDANLLTMREKGEEEESYQAKKMNCLRDILELALCCSKDSPKERISMEEAGNGLSKVKRTLLQITTK